MRRDVFPLADAKFDAWQKNFIEKARPNLGRWGIPILEFSTLELLQMRWTSAWEKAKKKDTRTRVDIQEKNTAKKEYVRTLRSFINRWIRFNPRVTEADRIMLGLPVKDTELTPAEIPNRAPEIIIDTVRHLVHRLRLIDPANPLRKGKPKGIREIEIFRFFGPVEPPDPSRYEFVGNATKILYNVHFKKEDVGKRVFYIARYVNTRGIPGPWSKAATTIVI